MRMLLLLIVFTFHVPSSNARGWTCRHSLTTESTIADAINIFSTQFLTVVSKNVTDNFVTSPLSAALAVLMIAFGAKGSTQFELNRLFRDSQCSISGNTKIGNFVKRFDKSMHENWHVSRKLFSARGIPIKPEFQNVTESVFGEGVETVNFRNPDAADEIINKWLEVDTNNRINYRINSGRIGNWADLVLVSTFDFKSSWNLKFDPNLTTDHIFYLTRNMSTKLKMMHRVGICLYGELPEVQATYVLLPLGGVAPHFPLSMYVIRPNARTGMKMLRSMIKNVLFVNELRTRAFFYYNVSLFLPKMKIEGSINVKWVVENMGPTNIFAGAMNLTGISDNVGIKVNSIIQKGLFEIDEEGGNSSAWEYQFSTPTENVVNKTIVFKVDRPFACIVANELGEILFSAIIYNPSIVMPAEFMPDA